ncbi:hypothetical protein J2T12_001430 [Paenibacillus anaericanus]|uniref:hypothetical protein n=1 Tax=Paenibacillus anaericanus TaxID=170367 RepID=UPI00277FEDA5|nr:hypothetical protein [Paenibacillus anaericanus]MDQ0088024.1 hypothetical protein [Paenibacillus anaericanus]
MKKFGFVLLSFFTAFYFTIGGFSLYAYLIFLEIKLHRRASIIDMDSDEMVIPPYPTGFKIGFFVSMVAFVVILLILIYFIIWYQFKYLCIKPFFKLTLFVIPVLCGYLLARESIFYWEATPPMNEEKAIQIAMDKNTSTTTNIFKNIHWDKINHFWIVEFSDQSGTSCDHFSISRLGVSISGGLCSE